MQGRMNALKEDPEPLAICAVRTTARPDSFRDG
jgi:hypothetical protein